MSMLQGNTYLLPIQIEDCDGAIIRGEQVERGEFVVGEIVKFYGADGEVRWDEGQLAFIMPLSERETFEFKKGAVKYQGRVLLKDGSVSGSRPTSEYIYESIGKTILSDGGVGEESGEILTIRLLDRVINTGITEEIDPTVPEYVKAISEQDIADWNRVKSLGAVYRAKGSVQTYADLPTENEVGDVWNVVEAYGDYGAGTNFVWTADGEWDALGGIGGGNAKKYQHNINLVHSNTSNLCAFSIINDTPTPYTTRDEVAQVLYNLGFTELQKMCQANGMWTSSDNKTIILGIYSSSSSSSQLVGMKIDGTMYEISTIAFNSSVKDTVIDLSGVDVSQANAQLESILGV